LAIDVDKKLNGCKFIAAKEHYGLWNGFILVGGQVKSRHLEKKDNDWS